MSELAPPKLAAMDKLHANCHDLACNTRFSPSKTFGFGHFGWIVNEQYHSKLVDFVPLTRRMTFGHRWIALALKFDSIDSKQVANLPNIIKGRLKV